MWLITGIGVSMVLPGCGHKHDEALEESETIVLQDSDIGPANNDTDTTDNDTGKPDTDVTDPGNDLDGDGYIDAEQGGDDCDDTDPDIHPALAEDCDGIDQDCDGLIDENASEALKWYEDEDADSYGNSAHPQYACEVPAGYVANHDDCNDSDSAIFPGADERCNALDDDCDELVDEDPIDLNTFYQDSDGDGYGVAADSVATCFPPEGYTEITDDCDDGDAATYPEAPEHCDGADQDCDSLIDEAPGGWFTDADGDGYGVDVAECDGEGDMALASGDCDDEAPTIYPGAPALCDGMANACEDTTWTTDIGTVSFESVDGDWFDHTADWEAGSSTALTHLIYAQPGTIHVCPETWYVSLTLEADITILGADRNTTSLSGIADDRTSLINIDADGLSIHIDELSLINGNGGLDSHGKHSGGAIRCESNSNLSGSNLSFENNNALVGGAIYSQGCPVELSDAEFLSNTSLEGAGALYISDGTATLDGLYFYQNEADFAGALFLNETETAITNSTFEANTSELGGAIWQWNGTVLLEDCALTDNTSVAGGKFNPDGGAIVVDWGTLSVVNTSFSDNTAANDGGAIYLDDSTGSTAELTEVTFSNNSPTDVDIGYSEYSWNDTITGTCTGGFCTVE